MDIFLRSGIFGLLIVVFSMALLITGAIAVPLTRSRRLLGVLTVLALLPIPLGLCGTWLGYRQIDAAVEAGRISFPGHPQGVFVHARREARSPTYLGAGATAVLLLAAGIGSVVTRPEAKPD